MLVLLFILILCLIKDLDLILKKLHQFCDFPPKLILNHSFQMSPYYFGLNTKK